jgi:hypothetical protein
MRSRNFESKSHQLVIVPQTIYEFWNVASRSVAANGLGKSASEAQLLIEEFRVFVRLLRDERGIFEKWMGLVTTLQIVGVKNYDARLAAAMFRHDISHILTFNPGDFRRFAHVTVLEPAVVLGP